MESSTDHTHTHVRDVQSLRDKLFYGSNAKHFYSASSFLFWNKQQNGRTCWLTEDLAWEEERLWAFYRFYFRMRIRQPFGFSRLALERLTYFAFASLSVQTVVEQQL